MSLTKHLKNHLCEKVLRTCSFAEIKRQADVDCFETSVGLATVEAASVTVTTALINPTKEIRKIYCFRSKNFLFFIFDNLKYCAELP